MHRTTLVSIAILGTFEVFGCASSRPPPTPADNRPSKELALEVVQSGMSKEAYRSMVVAMSNSVQQTMEKFAAAEGRPLPADSRAIAIAIMDEEMPYETVTSMIAEIYTRHFTEGELRELAAMHRSSIFQKNMALMPTLMGEMSQQVQQLLVVRQPEIQAKVRERLGAAALRAR